MNGLEAYRMVAEELDDPETSLSDLKKSLVTRAREYAKKNHKKWPPRPISSGWQVRIWRIG